jgi:hypothetical protein
MSLIVQMHTLGWRSHAANDLTFAWCDGTLIVHLADHADDDNDSNYEPSEGGNSHDDDDDDDNTTTYSTVPPTIGTLPQEWMMNLTRIMRPTATITGLITTTRPKRPTMKMRSTKRSTLLKNHPESDGDEEEHEYGHEAANDVHDEDEAPIISDNEEDDSSESTGVHDKDDACESAGVHDNLVKNTGVGETDPPETTGVERDQVTGVAGQASGKLETEDNTLKAEMDRKYFVMVEMGYGQESHATTATYTQTSSTQRSPNTT